MSGIRRFLLWARALIARGKVDDELTREMRFHLEMEVEKNVRAGLRPDEARRRALVDFGGVQRFREEVNDERGGTWVSGLSLDLKLAWRMLRKSPGLTVIGVLGIALGTAVGVAFFVVLTAHFFPKLPLHESEHLVALENWDVEANRPAFRSLDDFVTWRNEMRSVQPIAAAAYLGDRDLVTGDGVPETVSGAQMTAAGFQIARVPPLLGRYLLPDDERENAPRVAVIGYDLWQRFFAGDSSVIDRRILIDGEDHTIVGVMPPGFAFPKNQWLWTALTISPARYARGTGPPLFVFGRLAPGATWEQAQAELTLIGRRSATDFPATNSRLRPKLIPYTYPLNNTRAFQLREVAEIQLMVNLLLIAVSVNVGMLVYARTAMRTGEIAVRTALGASRRRIVGQLFVEALLLSLIGAGLGLGVAHAALGELEAMFMEGRPFWMDFGLQPRSVAFAVSLAIVSAVIVGVLPALKATGRRLNANLQSLTSGASLRLGRMWTALIVAQVAVVIAVLPTALELGYSEVRLRATRATFPAHEFLAANLGLAIPIRSDMNGERYRRESEARFAVALPALERDLEAEPAVAGVTMQGAGGYNLVEIEEVPGSAASGVREVASRGVATDYFEVLGAQLLAGRRFDASDASGGSLIVSEAFARSVLDGGRALGRRVRFLGQLDEAGQRPAGPWHEIVGVVEDLYTNAFDREDAPEVVYYAVTPERLQAVSLLVRVRGGEADRFIPRLHEIAATRNPDFRIGKVANLAVVPNSRYLAAVVMGIVLAMITVLLLSAVGIHALMSLTVTRRRKEMGIRIALGARSGRLLASIFSRAALQLGLGGLAGSLLAGALLRINGHMGPEAATFLVGVVVLMLMAGLLAAVGPARQGVRIQPMQALRIDD